MKQFTQKLPIKLTVNTTYAPQSASINRGSRLVKQSALSDLEKRWKSAILAVTFNVVEKQRNRIDLEDGFGRAFNGEHNSYFLLP